MKKIMLVLFMLAAVHAYGQHTVTVKDFIESGTCVLQKPIAIDTVDMNGSKQTFVGGTDSNRQHCLWNPVIMR